MSNRTKIVLIPYWMVEICTRHQLAMSAVLVPGKLKPIAAINDLVDFVALQDRVKDLLGVPDYGTSLSEIWAGWCSGKVQTDVAPADLLDVSEFVNNTLYSLSKATSNVDERLFRPDARMDQYSQQFHVYDLGPGIAGVVVYPGFEAKTSAPTQKSLLSDVLRVWYAYDAKHEVHKTPLFRRYLEVMG